MDRCEIVIVGAGNPGTSLAWTLAGRRSVLLLEQESQPGYHSTGRSAATLHRSYGNAVIRTLTAASAPFYLAPPAGFSEVALTSPRGAMVVADADGLAALDAEIEAARPFVPDIRRLDADECVRLVPALRREAIAAGMHDPGLLDLDVGAILAGFVRGARGRGAVLRGDALLVAAEPAAEGWKLTLKGGERLDCGILVNAAGGWADQTAGCAGLAPLGVVPLRRTAILVQAPAGSGVERWPMIHAADESWYVKPDAGRLLCSPADEEPCPPGDVQPEELDVAICVDRIERAFTFPIRRVENRWAGLRSFAPDRSPVVGLDPRVPGLLWLAGQGGYGIQTAPALAQLAAALLLGERPPEVLQAIDLAAIAPGRLLEA